MENGVEIELMHIGSRFDVSKFYQVYMYISTAWDNNEILRQLHLA